MGLLEASFPSKADNVLPDECFFTIYVAGGKYHEVKLPAGYYTKPDQIIVAMHLHNFLITAESTVVHNISLRATQDEIHDENNKLVRRESALQRGRMLTRISTSQGLHRQT